MHQVYHHVIYERIGYFKSNHYMTAIGQKSTENPPFYNLIYSLKKREIHQEQGVLLKSIVLASLF